MEINKLDLLSQSNDRIEAKWKTSTLITVITFGWAIALYFGLTSNSEISAIPPFIQIVLTIVYLPAYCMSLINILNEYAIFNELHESFGAELESSTEENDFLKVFYEKAYSVEWLKGNIKMFVIAMHLIYLFLLYFVVWCPGLYINI